MAVVTSWSLLGCPSIVCDSQAHYDTALLMPPPLQSILFTVKGLYDTRPYSILRTVKPCLVLRVLPVLVAEILFWTEILK